MVDKHSIKSRDFSCDLPHIIARLKVINGALEAEPDGNILGVLFYYLDECIEELEVINKELYWPETADNGQSHIEA